MPAEIVALRCPVCADPLDTRPQWTCRVCETPHHAECEQYIGGCSRFACTEAATPRRRVAEVLRLITNDQMIEHGTRCFGYFIGAPVFYLFAPILLGMSLYEGFQLLRAMHRRARLATALQHEELVLYLRMIGRDHPLLLYQGGREPPRPRALVALAQCAGGGAAISSAFLAVWHFAMREVTGGQVVALLLASQYIALGAFAMIYPQRWIVWKQTTYLKQAGRIFFHWREELLPLVFGTPKRKPHLIAEEGPPLKQIR